MQLFPNRSAARNARRIRYAYLLILLAAAGLSRVILTAPAGPAAPAAPTAPAAPAARPVAAVAPDIDSRYKKQCIAAECHPVEIRGHMPKHSPYIEGQCLSCHVDHASSQPQLLRSTGNEICLPCHKGMEMTETGLNTKHPPDSQRCLDCHVPHESKLRGMVRTAADLASCAECHKDFLAQSAEMPFRHEHFDPYRQCGLCHYAHKRASEHYLRENVGETCLTCHSLPIRIGSRIIEDISKQVRTYASVHDPVRKGQCPTCHTPHGSQQSSLLISGYPGGNYREYERAQYNLCWQCHDPKLVEQRKGPLLTKFRHGDMNLHRIHVVTLRRGRACLVCHTAHASDEPHLMSREARFRNWAAEMQFKSSPSGGACFTPCHTERGYDRNAPEARPPLPAPRSTPAASTGTQ
jgi:predicted CXXCH cytochrome family protein